jgi:citrate lyase subunit beta/citryl-CoA lyase
VIRSFLFVPGDSDSKLAKMPNCAADALILDLEDAVATERKSIARETIAGFLAAHPPTSRRWQLWVRINPLSSKDALSDLAAVMPGGPDGILLPKADSPADALRLSHYLDAFEAGQGRRPGATLIMPVATETAIAPFRLSDYAAATLPRLYGLTWGAEDLSAALCASTNLDASGDLAMTYRMARSLTLLAARAAGVEPIETLYVDFRDFDGLEASCRAARAEGFTGRIAIHINQVDIINTAFTPSAREIAEAEAVITAFAAHPGSGTVGLDGRMLDLPHLSRAKRTLETARLFSAS